LLFIFELVTPGRPNLLQARLCLEDAQLISYPAPAIAMGSFLLILMVFRDAVFSYENNGGMGVGPRRPALWLSLSLPGGSPDFQSYHKLMDAAVTTMPDSAKTYLRPVRQFGELRSQPEVII
jgi:hypothetical protein